MLKKAIFEKKNILITGGAGFVGSHLCDELVKQSKVICIDNFSTGDEKNIDHLLSNPDFEFIRHDLCEPIELENFPELEKFRIKFQGIQEIYNLACPTSPKNFHDNRIDTLLANSYAVKNTLDLAVKYDAKFLHFSSSVVYGPKRDSGGNIAEHDVGIVDMLSERSSYDEGKRFAETIVKNFRDVFMIDSKIVRIFRTYGPRMKLNDGQLIPDFIYNALDNKELLMHSDESETTSLCYIADIVDGAMKMMDSDSPGPVNLGSDVAVSMTEVANKIIEMTGSKSNVVKNDGTIKLPDLCIPDISKARTELGWIPVNTLEHGLEMTIEDLRATKGLKTIKGVI